MLISPTSHLYLLPPSPHYWAFAGEGWECVLDFDNERDQET